MRAVGAIGQLQHAEGIYAFSRLTGRVQCPGLVALAGMQGETYIEAELAVAIIQRPLMQIKIRAWQAESELMGISAREKPVWP